MPSSVIRWFRHDPETNDLLIVFQTGRRYVYRGVPEAEATAMRQAFSKGEYFNARIRDNYRFERLG